MVCSPLFVVNGNKPRIHTSSNPLYIKELVTLSQTPLNIHMNKRCNLRHMSVQFDPFHRVICVI